MQLSYLTLGALAVTANAFLVPLESQDLPVNELTVNPGPEFVKLDCSTCPYALKSEPNGQREWSNDVANELEMEFQVIENAITFNGVALYPVTSPGLPPALTVSQKAKDGAEASVEGQGQDLRLSYSIEMEQKPFEDGNSLITITISPMALDGQMIRVDDLEVKAIRDSTGTVRVLKRPCLPFAIVACQADIVTPQVTLHSVTTIAPAPDAPDAQCGNVMCRVMSKLVGSIARVKSTAKAAAHKVKCFCVKCFRCVLRMMGHKQHDHNEGAHGPDGMMGHSSHHHFGPQDGRPHPHYHHEWHTRSFFGRMVHILWVTVKIAFVPILIGIAFGMAASAIGMLVGHAIVFLWMRYRHNDEAPAYEELPTDEKEEVPPPYDDLPTAVQEAINEKDVEAKA